MRIVHKHNQIKRNTQNERGDYFHINDEYAFGRILTIWADLTSDTKHWPTRKDFHSIVMDHWQRILIFRSDTEVLKSNHSPLNPKYHCKMFIIKRLKNNHFLKPSLLYGNTLTLCICTGRVGGEDQLLNHFRQGWHQLVAETRDAGFAEVNVATTHTMLFLQQPSSLLILRACGDDDDRWRLGELYATRST